MTSCGAALHRGGGVGLLWELRRCIVPRMGCENLSFLSWQKNQENQIWNYQIKHGKHGIIWNHSQIEYMENKPNLEVYQRHTSTIKKLRFAPFLCKAMHTFPCVPWTSNRSQNQTFIFLIVMNPPNTIPHGTSKWTNPLLTAALMIRGTDCSPHLWLQMKTTIQPTKTPLNTTHQSLRKSESWD